MPIARTLVINCGSSSFKWSVLGADGAVLSGGNEHWKGDALEEKKRQVAAVLNAAGDVGAVGHRVTHGGARFHASVLLDEGVRKELEALVPLDALHLRPALAAIDAVSEEQAGLKQVIAFDTAFHSTMPPAAALYAIPPDWTEKRGIRRFGFHGLSVDGSTSRAAELFGALPKRLVVCHLGSGCSITAVENGRSIDNTMGFSPLDGLVMATRAGALDPGAVLHLIAEEKLSAAQTREALEQKCGWFGVSGVSTDLREVLAAADLGNARASLAVGLFVQSLRRALGAASGVLGGVDAVIFTGGIGENSARIRLEAARALPGLHIDPALNDQIGEHDALISAAPSQLRAAVVHAREDLVVLREVHRLIRL